MHFKRRLFLSILFISTTVVGLHSCKIDADPAPKQSPDYSVFYSYFPLEHGYEWEYDVHSIRLMNGEYDTTRSNWMAQYDSSRQSIHYSDSASSYYSIQWRNSGKYLTRNRGFMLDYSLMNCDTGSVLLPQPDELSVIQFCGEHFEPRVPKYSHIKAKRVVTTIYRGTFPWEQSEYVFADGIGMIYQSKKVFDHFKLVSVLEYKLKNHNF